MKKCPKCGSTRYRDGKIKSCPKCGYVNDPNYLNKLKEIKQ